MSKPILKYVGTGSLIEIPARDLTEQDLKNIAWTGWDADKLVESGLYELTEVTDKIEILDDGGNVVDEIGIVPTVDEAIIRLNAKPKKRGK